MTNSISTDICIIGAGPVGLFAVFEAGLLKLRCHVVDALPQVGGQLSEIYPKKPIYDIPGFPEVLAGDLVSNLMRQIEPFHPTFTLGERVEGYRKLEDGSFVVNTIDGTEINCKAIAIAGGLGSFEPRKPAIEDLTTFEGGKGVYYMVRDPETFRDQRLVIAGGGDSALDWTIFLADVAREVTLVHRGTTFRGAADSAEKVQKLHEAGRVKLVLSSNVTHVHGNGRLNAVTITANGGDTEQVEVDSFIPLFGLTPKLGPIGDWGLELESDGRESEYGRLFHFGARYLCHRRHQHLSGQAQAHPLRLPRGGPHVPGRLQVHLPRQEVHPQIHHRQRGADALIQLSVASCQVVRCAIWQLATDNWQLPTHQT